MNGTAWNLLIASLPTGNTALRMRLWRGMKGIGAAPVRDGVWLCPGTGASDAMDAMATALVNAGGDAERITFSSRNDAQEARMQALFDRSDDYARLIEAMRQQAGRTSGQDSERTLRRLRRELDALKAIDFFPQPSREEADALLLELERLGSPGEPGQTHSAIRRLATKDYQGRTWATRARPWVDRMASAWLISRHIDRKAHFIWLVSPADCPPEALGFDFDGATFTHVGHRVTFETLMACFDLEGDAALARLAQIVHSLDVGGNAPEAAGLECVLRGLRQRHGRDDALMKAANQVFDDLYAVFREET